MWKCPRCGHWFVTRNLWHSCERVSVASHFAGRDPGVRLVWRALLGALRAIGPVKVSPNRTRIAIMTRTRFCGALVRRDHLRCAFVLTRQVDDRRIVKHEFLPPHYHIHWMRLERPDQLDATVRAWLAESYRMGEQEHL